MNFLKLSRPRPNLPADVGELQNFLAFAVSDLLSAMRSIPRNYPNAEHDLTPYEINLLGTLVQPREKCLSPIEAMANIFSSAARLQIHFASKKDPREQLSVLESLDPESIACMCALLMLVVRASGSDSEMLRKRARFLMKGVGVSGLVDWADAFTEEAFPGLMEFIDSEDDGLRNAIFGE